MEAGGIILDDETMLMYVNLGYQQAFAGIGLIAAICVVWSMIVVHPVVDFARGQTKNWLIRCTIRYDALALSKSPHADSLFPFKASLTLTCPACWWTEI